MNMYMYICIYIRQTPWFCPELNNCHSHVNRRGAFRRQCPKPQNPMSYGICIVHVVCILPCCKHPPAQNQGVVRVYIHTLTYVCLYIYVYICMHMYVYMVIYLYASIKLPCESISKVLESESQPDVFLSPKFLEVHHVQQNPRDMTWISHPHWFKNRDPYIMA